MFRSLLFALLVLPGGSLGATPAAAQTRIFVSCPNGVPCTEVVHGHIDAVGTARLPWVVSLPVSAGVCLIARLESSDTDDIKTIIAPNGVVYRDTSRVEVSPTVEGWYTIQIDTLPPGLEQIFEVELSLLATQNCIPTPGR